MLVRDVAAFFLVLLTEQATTVVETVPGEHL